MTNSSIKSLALLLAGAGLMAAGGVFYLNHPEEAAPPPATSAAPSSLHATAPIPTNPDLPVITVWKDPTCGCCAGWVDHLRAAGYPVQVEEVADLAAVKRERGVAPELQSCHTALVEGYTVEGHVPVADIERLLKERPQIVGIAAPGMPVGSPGMEMGNQHDRYDVVAIERDGKTHVWATHP